MASLPKVTAFLLALVAAPMPPLDPNDPNACFQYVEHTDQHCGPCLGEVSADGSGCSQGTSDNDMRDLAIGYGGNGTVQECKDACNASPDCAGFVFTEGVNECRFKSNSPELKPYTLTHECAMQGDAWTCSERSNPISCFQKQPK